jgi:hypothetical protein
MGSISSTRVSAAPGKLISVMVADCARHGIAAERASSDDSNDSFIVRLRMRLLGTGNTIVIDWLSKKKDIVSFAIGPVLS